MSKTNHHIIFGVCVGARRMHERTSRTDDIGEEVT